jgi:hypothetical protein
MDSGIKTERKSLAHSQVQSSAQTHAQPRRLYSALRSTLSSLRLFLLSIPAVPSLRIIRAEVRSCYGRICVLRDRNRESRDSYLTILDLGPMCEAGPDGHLQLCRESLYRSDGIVKIFAKYPWASAGDGLLFLEGWDMARQCARDKADIARREKTESF